MKNIFSRSAIVHFKDFQTRLILIGVHKLLVIVFIIHFLIMIVLITIPIITILY